MEIPTEQPKFLCRAIAKLGGWPWVIACTASTVAVGLAIAAQGNYDPHLAVLTATLVAVIWYAYFTFRGVRQPARVTLRINPDLRFDSPSQEPALYPEVQNRTERTLYARFMVRVWVDEEPVRLGSFFRGEEVVAIPGLRGPRAYVPLQSYLIWRHERMASQQVHVAFRVEWIDSLCEEGGHPTMYWHIDLQEKQTTGVIAPDQIRRLFGNLPDPYPSD